MLSFITVISASWYFFFIYGHLMNLDFNNYTSSRVLYERLLFLPRFLLLNYECEGHGVFGDHKGFCVYVCVSMYVCEYVGRCALFISHLTCSWLHAYTSTTSSVFFPLALCFLSHALPLPLSRFFCIPTYKHLWVVPWSLVPPDPTFLNLYLWDNKPWLMY